MNYDTEIPSYARHTEHEVCGFFGPYRFLSNFYDASVYYGGRWFRRTENAFQFAKLIPVIPDDEDDYKEWYEKQYEIVAAMPAREVKKWGKSVKMRDDWEIKGVRKDVMLAVVFDKFFRHRDLRAKLLETGARYLEETNSWRDTTWGICDGIGTNYLGKITMNVRDLFIKHQIL